MELKISRSKRYEKNFKKLFKSKKINVNKLHDVVNKLASGEKLSKSYKDHKLHGELKDFRECHIQPDILLIYQIKKEELVLLLLNIGSHSELFD